MPVCFTCSLFFLSGKHVLESDAGIRRIAELQKREQKMNGRGGRIADEINIGTCVGGCAQEGHKRRVAPESALTPTNGLF